MTIKIINTNKKMVIWLSLQIHVGIISNVINTIGVNVTAPTFHGLAPILS